MVAELGGMRILENAQPLVVALINELNKQLPTGKQIEEYDFPVDEPQNIAYLRGVYLRLVDFTTEPGKVPYRLSFLENGSSPGSIIVNAIEQLVPGITNPALTEDQRRMMARNAFFEGKPLYQQGFWNVERTDCRSGHLQGSGLRKIYTSLPAAVENGFSLVRNAREGRLTISDDRGRVLAEASSEDDGQGF